MKKVIKISILLFVFFGISSTSFAASYFFNLKNTYRVDIPPQVFEWGPYSDLKTCQASLAKAKKDRIDSGLYNSKYDTWGSCFTIENIKITDVSPKEGMPGDMLAITGTNFKQIESVTFGKIGLKGPFLISDGARININIPNTATEGKATITIKDYTRGSATTDVTVKTTGQMWYWSNEYHQIMGKGGFRSTEGFATKKECDDNRAEALKSRGSKTAFAECFPSTKTVISAAVQNEIDATNGTVSVDKELTGNRVFDEDYNLLAPLPGITKVDKTNTLGTYLNFIFKFAISICAALAVLMIVIYGVQYMGDGSVFGHTEAKSKIGAAIMGLLLALGAYALLNTINPDLVGSNGININQVTINISPSLAVQTPSTGYKVSVNGGKALLSGGSFTGASAGIYCPKKGGRAEVRKIAESFLNKGQYKLGGVHWNQNSCPSGKVCLDCGGFVDTVLMCAGMNVPSVGPNYNGTNYCIQAGVDPVSKCGSVKIASFTESNKIKVGGSNIDLQPGDVLQWPSQGQGHGHNYIYIGNGEMMDINGKVNIMKTVANYYANGAYKKLSHYMWKPV